jgi:hypothetical protein
MNASTFVQKLWNYCNVLRDDGSEASMSVGRGLFGGALSKVSG